ncbi:MAG: 4Fe-4S binding protein [Desulfobacter sp.]
MRFQRVVQFISFISFIVLLWLAAFPLVSPVPVDVFLGLDPVIFWGTALSTRSFASLIWFSLIVLAFTVFIGRFFCSTICPMGATIDFTDRLIRSKQKKTVQQPTHAKSLKYLKYQLLLVILGSALMGVSLVFIASPISLITHFYGLIIHPALCLIADKLLIIARPVADYFDITSLSYAQIAVPNFALQWFSAILFVLIFACAVWTPRFWCRYLCPSGAIFALFSVNPFWKRQVSEECIQCGRCQKHCPMSAIGEHPFETEHSECIVCETCVKVCPVNAVSFTCTGFKKTTLSPAFSKSRRKFIWAGASGVGAGIVSLTDMKSFHQDSAIAKIIPPELIRPPGALPEKDFLARCVRCGECMKACPSNTLQPIGLAAGFSAFFSPKITPGRGPCESLCNVCGHVCPTGAIRPLPVEEKIWAKMGTAHILKHKCLAWEFNKKCMVCDEVCPYNAIEFKVTPGSSVAVPFINESKCSGCGFCEHFCPVHANAAIMVEPMGALRIEQGSHREKAKQMGLSLQIKKARDEAPEAYPLPEYDGQGLPPGFTE